MEKNNEENRTESLTAHFELPPESDEKVLPWEEVEPGRFMPRRVRGSCEGRALG